MGKAAAPPAKGGGKKFIIMLAVVGLVAIGAGAALPILIASKSHDKDAKEHADKKKSKEPGRALIPFDKDGVNANLAEGKLTRVIRVKLTLVVEGTKEKEVNELMVKQKAYLKNWLISYLADRTLGDVTGAANINRMRREIRDNFNLILSPDGSEKIIDVLVEDFGVQ